MGRGRKNDYGLSDAFGYFKKAFVGSSASRRKYQAKLFVTLGHIVHMLQDLHSPAHCRDNSHVDGDYLEIFGRYDGGFNLRNGVFNPKNNYWVKDGIEKRGNSRYLFDGTNFFGYEDFFRYGAMWVGNNFASESHFGIMDDPNKQTGIGLSVNNYFDNVSLFDGRNTHPSKSETFERKVNNYASWGYIYTEGNIVLNFVTGAIQTNFSKIGLVEHGIIFDRYHMIAPEYKRINGGLVKTGLNQKPLEDTAVNVMPRAVAATQAFIDYFFRGQMDVHINSEGNVIIKNVSDASTLKLGTLGALKKGGKFSIYYRNGNENKLFSIRTLDKDIFIGESITLYLGKKVFKNMSQGTKITVIFEGDIGIDFNDYDSYNIGSKGLSVDVVDLPNIKQEEEEEEEEEQPDTASYRYVVTTVDHTNLLPSRHGDYSNISYDVDIYRNNVLHRTERKTDLLEISWWNGSAHFGDNAKHHFDITCEKYNGLCNYLTNKVPTDSNKPYPGYPIDWTIWNFGLAENSIALFLYNIRTQIGNYYALTKTRKKSGRSKYVDTSSELSISSQKDTEASVAEKEKMKYEGEVQTEKLRTLDGVIIDSNHSTQAYEQDIEEKEAVVLTDDYSLETDTNYGEDVEGE